MHLIFGLTGGVLGASQFSIGALLVGVIIGLLAAEVLSLRKRLAALEKSQRAEVEQGEVVTVVPEEYTSPLPLNKERLKEDLAGIDPQQKFIVPKKEAAPPDTAPTESLLGTLRGESTAFFRQIKRLLTSGNPVLKIGVIILFFGVSFLLKYAAQRNMLPIEFRLAGVASGGVGMLSLGWWFRRSNSVYGLVLQGGGFGLLYLVIFATARLYSFVPIPIALLLMIVLVTLSCLFAIIQNARSLAVFAIIGGFLAPVLMSPGDEGHVVLFSYYVLLNTGILAISWFKSWRELNLLGFVFTFALGTYWGSSGYRPEHFHTTEPFLLLFFVFYVLIAIFFAHRQPLQLRGYIDGPLVFALPLVVSFLQYFLVKDFQFGMAFSAFGFGLFYLLVALLLWRKKVDSMGSLCEAFLALGLVFGSLAIPLAFDEHLSSSIWALEGAGMVWIGVRQKRMLARHCGLLLQFAAACIFVDLVWYPLHALAFANRYFLGCLFLSLAALFSSYCLDMNRGNLMKWERYFPVPLLIWGLVWWYIGGLREIDRQLPAREAMSGFLLFCSASSIVMGLTIQKLNWPRFKLSLLVQLPVMAVLVLLSLIHAHTSFHLLRGSGAVAWAVAFAVQYRILYNYSEAWPRRYREYWHMGSMWLLLYVVCHEAAWWVRQVDDIAVIWSMIIWALIPCILLFLMLYLGKGQSWPLGKYSSVYLGPACVPVVVALVCWTVGSFFQAGDPAPLPYLPFLNPMEITEIAVLTCIVLWLLACKADDFLNTYFSEKLQFWGLGLLVFFWLNSVAARAVHFFTGVPYTPFSLYNSVVFQASIAALWGCMALVITVSATRRGSRSLWRAGALLLAMVVVKLLVIDLSGSGTIARIISFLVVGILMLIIGYFSPLPPHPEKGLRPRHEGPL